MAAGSRKLSKKGQSNLLPCLGVVILMVSLSSVFISWKNIQADSLTRSILLDPIPSGETAKRRFYTDDMCSNCRFVVSGPSSGAFTCQFLILRRQRKNSQTYEEAARSLAKDKPDHCGRCDPSSCPAHEKRYWRMDAVAPMVRSSQTLSLRSIPSENQLPLKNENRLRDYATSIHATRFHFYEFNPSIVRLPDAQVPIDGAVYLASFRVSSQHNCVADQELDLQLRGGTWPKKSMEYLGLAILDANLQILREVIVDAMSVMHKLQDARLFVLQGQIYVTSFHRVHAIWLRDAPANNETIILPPVWNPPVGSNPLQVTWRTVGACSRDSGVQKGGKNLNYFVDTVNRTILEVQPMGGKDVVDLQTKCQKSSHKDVPGKRLIRYNGTRPSPTFATVDELDFGNQYPTQPPYTGERGSACCVPMEYEGRQVLLGISHSKTKFKHTGSTPANKTKGAVASNHFFSNFYVIEATEPYKPLALSGKFCLAGSAGKWNQQALEIGGRRYDCPRIHFVSGMVLKADDPSQLIIAFGVNDCVPIMTVVDMEDVRRMLFSPETLK